MAAKLEEHCTNGCSPSSSSRWIECSGSARLVIGMPNKINPITDLGSYFHELAAYKVNKALKRRCEKPTSVLNNEESDEFTDEYAKFVMKIVKREMRRDPNAKVLVEERVSIDEFINGTFGTCDLGIVSKGKLYVIDAKFGFKEVSPIKNKQLSIYALGLISKYGETYGIEKVTLGIYQPRIQRCIQTYQTTAKRITKWGNEVLKVVGKEILEGKGQFKIGDYCGYCSALSHCRKHLKEFVNMQELVTKEPNKLTDDELVQVLEQVDSVVAFIDSVKEYALSQMMEGKEIPNFKVVEGRSNYKFTDEDKVVSECIKAGYKDIFKKSLISVAKMKKLMEKKDFNKVLGSLVTRPQGKATLAKLSDKRPAMDLSTLNKILKNIKENKSMRKKIIINVIYENEKMNTVQDTVTIPANNLFTNGMLNDLGMQKVSNVLYGLLDHAGTDFQIGIEVEGSRFDDESNDYIKSNSVTVFVLSPEERLLLMIFKEINKSVIKDINSMNASVEESLKEIKVEEIKGEKE